MLVLPDDPFHPDGIAGFASRLRRGETTAEAVTGVYLARIEALDPHLRAFEVVDDLSDTTYRNGYMQAIPGVIRPRLQWQIGASA